MSFLESLRLALAVLWANRLRSFLTILGNVVAVSSVVAVVAIINGFNSYVADRILLTGSHVFTVTKFGFTTDEETFHKMMRRRNLTLDDSDALGRQMQNAMAVVPVVSRQENLRAGGRRRPERASSVWARGTRICERWTSRQGATWLARRSRAGPRSP